MVATHPVDATSGGVRYDAFLEADSPNALPQLGFRVERLLRVAVGDQFQPDDKATAADVADMRMLAEALLEPAEQQSAQMPHARQQPVALDRLLNAERGGDRDGVAGVGVGVLSAARGR